VLEYLIREDNDVRAGGYRQAHWWTVLEGTSEYGFEPIAACARLEDAEALVTEKEKEF
jgi:hypothetical protein